MNNYLNGSKVTNKFEITNRGMTDSLILVKTQDKMTKRLVLKDCGFINKTKEEIQEEIIKVSNFYEIDVQSLNQIYYECTGNWNITLNYINNQKEVSNLNFWSKIEDEIIMTDDLNQIDKIIEKRGIDQVMIRRLFIKKYS